MLLSGIHAGNREGCHEGVCLQTAFGAWEVLFWESAQCLAEHTVKWYRTWPQMFPSFSRDRFLIKESGRLIFGDTWRWGISRQHRVLRWGPWEGTGGQQLGCPWMDRPVSPGDGGDVRCSSSCCLLWRITPERLCPVRRRWAVRMMWEGREGEGRKQSTGLVWGTTDK